MRCWTLSHVGRGIRALGSIPEKEHPTCTVQTSKGMNKMLRLVKFGFGDPGYTETICKPQTVHR